MTNAYHKEIEIASVNKERQRTSFVSHIGREKAIKNITEFEKTPYYINLKGNLDFYINKYLIKIQKDISTNVNQSDPNWVDIKIVFNQWIYSLYEETGKNLPYICR